MSVEANSEATPTKPVPKPVKRRRKSGVTLLPLMLVAAVLIVLGVLIWTEQEVEAPEWLRDRIETRLEQDLPGLKVEFGEVAVRLTRNGLMRLRLRDVDIRNAQGANVIQLSDLEAGLSPEGLVRGRPVIKEAALSGAFLTLLRARDGTLGLALGDAFASGTEAPSIASMFVGLDQLLDTEQFADLREVEANALTIRYEDARARRGWTADGGRLRATRDGDLLRLAGDLALLSGGDGVATLELNAEREIGVPELSFGFRLGNLSARDIASQSAALAWLETLKAPISGALRSRLLPDGSVGRLDATLQIGAGVIQPTPQAEPLPFDAARAYFSYLPGAQKLQFDEILVRSERGEVFAEGTASLRGIARGGFEALDGQFTLSKARLAAGPLYDRDVELKDVNLTFQLGLDPFLIRVGEARLNEPGMEARATARLSADERGWSVALDASAPQTNPGQVLDFWPTWFRPGTRDWVSRHVVKGDILDPVFALRLTPGQAPVTYLDFGFRNAEVKYNLKLPPVSNGSGQVILDGPRISVAVDRGQVRPSSGGVVDVSGSRFMIADARLKPATGKLDLKASGPIAAALSYIDTDPLRVLARAGRKPDLATGQARVTGTLALPLKRGVRFEDMDLRLAGDLRNVVSTTLVPGRKLTGQALKLALDSKSIKIEGGVEVSGVPADGTWAMTFGQRGGGKVDAVVRLTDASLRAFGVNLPKGMVSGRGRGQLALDLSTGGAPTFTISSDLAGLGLSIPQIGYRLGEKSKGRFSTSGTLGSRIQLGELRLSGGGLEAVGRVDLTEAGGFRALRLSKLQLSDWLNVQGAITARGNAAPAIEVTGGRVDMRRAKFGGGGGGSTASAGGGAPMSVRLDELRVTDTIRLERFAGDFTTAGGLDGKFTGRLGGSAAVQGRLQPKKGGTALRVVGDDAGRILRAAGLLKTVAGGSFRLSMTPVRGKTGTYDGQLDIKRVRLRDAPAIGALLDAVSIVGLLDQLNGPGIYFDDVEAEFRLTPQEVILTRSSAVGPSMGISLDGYYDLAKGRMDMQGVLSPIYILNAVGRIFSRKGEGLIGFNFNLRGPVSKPQVLVNPLSVFTPGMFRDIFRRPPPKVSQ